MSAVPNINKEACGVCLVGTRGCSKTALVRQMAAVLGYKTESIQMNADMLAEHGWTAVEMAARGVLPTQHPAFRLVAPAEPPTVSEWPQRDWQADQNAEAGQNYPQVSTSSPS